MIEQELLDDIRDVASMYEVSELGDYDASELLTLIQDSFIDSSALQWWWESIKDESIAIQYGDSDGLSVIRDLIDNSGPVFLVPTDDESPPWPVFSGRIDQIIEMLRELRFFEYFLTDENSTWVVFDTHHNSLVVAGILVTKTKELQGPLS